MARMTTDLTREEMIVALIERDGNRCMFPGCDKPFDNGNHMITFDHIYPQYLAKQAGWTRAQTDDLSNLQLMGKTCNAIKGHQLPDDDGNFKVPVREPRTVKGPRPEICDTCYSGRILLIGEECYDCGSGPQPAMYPASLQRKPKDCDHSTFLCWLCHVHEPELRVPATQRLITGP